jgi:hypothetical protein
VVQWLLHIIFFRVDICAFGKDFVDEVELAPCRYIAEDGLAILRWRVGEGAMGNGLGFSER